MDVDEEKEKDTKEEEKAKEEEKEKEKEKEKDASEKKEEANFETLANPARVMKPQLKVVTFEEKKYRSIKDISTGGIIMMKNISGEKCEIVEPVSVEKANAGDSEDEPEPPEPFKWEEE